MKLKLTFALLPMLFVACVSYQVQLVSTDYVSPSKNRNVCKLLKDSVVVYALFVDANHYHPWTDYDVNSTIDSLRKAMDWVESKAAKNGIALKIKTVNHIDKGKLSFSEKRARTKYSLSQSHNYTSKRKIKKKENRHYKWIDRISKYAGKSISKTTTTKVAVKNKINNTERLIAALRDKNKNDNIALMVFVNGYYESTASVTYNSYTSGPRVEFSVITNKNPAVIAHEFLHLFGAIDLYPNALHSNFNFKDIEEKYPNEIMNIQHKEISKLMLSPITKYYIGWQNELDLINTRILYHKAELTEY